MNDEDTAIVTAGIYDGTTITGSVTMPVGNSYTISNSSLGSIAMGLVIEDVLDKYDFNKIVVDHKVQEQELAKLKEVAPDYASEIKDNLARNAARDIIKKMTFTKKHDKDTDVHHFIGRCWVFTEEELKAILNEVRNA